MGNISDDDGANLLTGDALHGNFGNEGPRRHITRGNPMQSEARSGKRPFASSGEEEEFTN